MLVGETAIVVVVGVVIVSHTEEKADPDAGTEIVVVVGDRCLWLLWGDSSSSLVFSSLSAAVSAASCKRSNSF